MPKNLISAKFEHVNRNDAIWALLKKYPGGITRQNLSKLSGYGINEVCSAVGALQDSISIVGTEINPDSGLKVELVAPSRGQPTLKSSRKGELKRLRARVQELEKNQSLLITKLKQLLVEVSK